MATKAQIVKRALIRAGVIPYDREPTAEESQQVTATLESIHAKWVDEDRVRWELTDIPQEIEDPLVSILAYSIADDFGVPDSRYSRLAATIQSAMQKIYAYDAEEYTGKSSARYY